MPGFGFGVGFGLSRPGKPTPGVITGTARPGNTLTSTRAGQWRINGVDVIGQTGNTFAVPYTTSPGDLITQAPASNTRTVAAYDTDAAAEITAVISAGGSGEWGSSPGNRANNKWLRDDMVIALKAAGLFTGFKYRVLAGTNTIAGGLVAGKGGAITNNNFVSGDIDLLTGWMSDGTTKYLGTDWAGNANGQNDFSAWCWVTSAPTSALTVKAYFGNSTGGGTGTIQLLKASAGDELAARAKNTTIQTPSGNTSSLTGLFLMDRMNSGQFVFRNQNTEQVFSIATDGNSANALTFFSRAAVGISDARISAFGTGPSVQTSGQRALLESILQNYHNSLQA